MSRHKLAIIHLNIITRGDKTIALRIENTHFYWDFLSSRRGWRQCKRCNGSHKTGRFHLLPQIHSYTERSFHRIDDRNRSTRIAAPSVSITRSEEHTSELQSLMRSSYAVFCLKKK